MRPVEAQLKYVSGRHAPAIVLLDTIVQEIDRELAMRPPERGGALLGPEGRELITHLFVDEHARTTKASYEASEALMTRVASTENDSILRWKGIIHSHPGSMADLSGPDLERLHDGLNGNPWLPWLHAPIVTRRSPLGHEAQALDLGHGWLMWHTARLLRDGSLVIEQRNIVVLPLGADLRRLATKLQADWTTIVTDPGTGVTGAGGRLTLRDERELLVFVSEHYPLAAPLVLLTAPDGDTEELSLVWSVKAGRDRLTDAVMAALPQAKSAAGATGTISFGPRADLPVTADPVRAAQAGWAPAEGDLEATLEHLRDKLGARAKGLTSATLSKQTVLIVGCGSVGSYAAEHFARAGVGTLMLVDPDGVDATNLSRTVFELSDLQQPKVESLRRRLVNLNPSLAVSAHPTGVGQMPSKELDALVQAADIVLATTDDPEAQMQLARHAQRHERPSLFVGLTAGARGGEVIVTVPGQTPCYRCATPLRHERDADPGLMRDRDYGTGRMHGVIALGVDIQFVAGVAVKVALSLLLKDQPDAELGRFISTIFDQHISFLTFSMREDYWFFPSFFETITGQFGYQSVGFRVEGDPDCPICGSSPDLALPSDEVAPSSAEIQAALSAEEDSQAETSVLAPADSGSDVFDRAAPIDERKEPHE